MTDWYMFFSNASMDFYSFVFAIQIWLSVDFHQGLFNAFLLCLRSLQVVKIMASSLVITVEHHFANVGRKGLWYFFPFSCFFFGFLGAISIPHNIWFFYLKLEIVNRTLCKQKFFLVLFFCEFWLFYAGLMSWHWHTFYWKFCKKTDFSSSHHSTPPTKFSNSPLLKREPNLCRRKPTIENKQIDLQKRQIDEIKYV